ncbi:hypothetical protein PanWU01x14_240430 [Parasponia andersonii]|uniref:Uncharacterized protein n=1 Tax=Parasponia andersonii TaxID=3476 RepID=A0A2P5BGP4_PARAD|nr:hypothetical protein PanWU01x14_240430 [Parasponia andersonii]
MLGLNEAILSMTTNQHLIGFVRVRSDASRWMSDYPTHVLVDVRMDVRKSTHSNRCLIRSSQPDISKTEHPTYLEN